MTRTWVLTAIGLSLLTACSSADPEACRSHRDCLVDEVCDEGACRPAPDAGEGDAGVSEDAGETLPEDAIAPSVTVESPAEGQVVKGQLELKGAAQDETGVRAVYVAIDSAFPRVASGTTSWRLVLDTTLLAEGEHQIRVFARDAAGNASEEVTRTITVKNIVNGLAAHYFHYPPGAQPNLVAHRLSRLDPNVDFDWGSNSPAAGSVDADYFAVRWVGQVQPRYSEEYTFFTTSDDGVRLWVNGALVIDDWRPHGTEEQFGKITLAAGTLYDLRLEYLELNGPAVVSLAWSSASQAREAIPSDRLRAAPLACGNSTCDEGEATSCPLDCPSGLSAHYFTFTPGQPALGTHKFSRLEPNIDFNLGEAAPSAAVTADYWATRWVGQVIPRHTERYTFLTRSDDGVRLWIDGVLVIDDWTSHAATDRSGAIDLRAGEAHSLRLDYFDDTSIALATLSWESASQTREVVPTSQLRPGPLGCGDKLCFGGESASSCPLDCP